MMNTCKLITSVDVDTSKDIAMEMINVLADGIISSVFKDQKIVSSVEWFDENCLHNRKLDEFVDKWLSNNDNEALVRSMHNGLFKTNVQIGALALITYLRLSSLDAELCESIIRRILGKPKK